VVGWYHSHPNFPPDPSVTDLINQRNYQTLFHDAEANLSPFLGLIVGTYDPTMSSAESIFRWFHVRSNTGKGPAKAYGKGPAKGSARGPASTVPMELKAVVRTFKPGLTQEERAKRRERTLARLRVRHEASARAARLKFDGGTNGECTRVGQGSTVLVETSAAAAAASTETETETEQWGLSAKVASNEPSLVGPANSTITGIGASRDRERAPAPTGDGMSRPAPDDIRQPCSPLDFVTSCLLPLSRYYSVHDRRANWNRIWRQDMTKGEKLEKSLAAWMYKMGFRVSTNEPVFLGNFLRFVFSLWEDTASKRSTSPGVRFSGGV